MTFTITDIFTGIGVLTVIWCGGWGLGYVLFWLFCEERRSDTAIKSCFKRFDGKYYALDTDRHVQKITGAFLDRYTKYNAQDYWLNKSISKFINALSKELQRRQERYEANHEAEMDRIRGGM